MFVGKGFVESSLFKVQQSRNRRMYYGCIVLEDNQQNREYRRLLPMLSAKAN